MRLSWDSIGAKLYRAGLDRGVLYLYRNGAYENGVAWNGLTGIDDNSSGHDKTLLYTNDRRSAVLFSPKEYGGNIKCFTYPDEFEECIGNEEVATGLYAQESEGSQFGFSYRTKVGSDMDPNYAYEIHLVYGAYVTDAKEEASTIGESSDVNDLNFGFESIPEEYDDHTPCSHFKVDSRFVSQENMQALEGILYGTDETSPRLPLPNELVELLTVPEPPAEYVGYPDDRIYIGGLYPMEPS